MIVRLWKSTLILASNSMFAQLATAITYWLVARSVGPNDFGLLTSAVGVATLLLTSVDFGLNSLTVRQLAIDKSNTSVFDATFSAKVATSTLVGGVWILVTGVVSYWHSSWIPLILLGVYIVASDVTSTLLVVPKSYELMHQVAMVTLLQKLVMLIVVWIALWFGAGVHALVVGMVVGALASIAMCRLYVEHHFWIFTMPSFHAVKDLWRASMGFGVAGFAAQLQRLDVLIVTMVAGPTAAGLYAAPSRITNMIAVLPSALGSAILPRVASGRAAGQSRRYVIVAIGVVAGISAVGLLVVALLADQVVPWALGEDYLDSVPVLKVFLVGVFLMCVNAPLAALFQAEGRDRDVAFIVGTASIIGLVAVSVGAYLADEIGAAFGYVVLQLVIFIPLLSVLRKPAVSIVHATAD